MKQAQILNLLKIVRYSILLHKNNFANYNTYKLQAFKIKLRIFSVG